MPRRTTLMLLLVLAAAQLTAAGWSIVRYESTLASGTPYKLRVVPVDPADAFHGRYVAIRPAITLTPPIAPETEAVVKSFQQERATGFVVLGADAQGFARAVDIVPTRPAGGDYLAVDDVRLANNAANGYTISLPFDRYYMNEASAPAAQERYTAAVGRNARSTAWLSVRVKNGAGVIDGLFIDGVPIEQVVGGRTR